MASRSRTTMKKRQKELARLEKRRDKEARRAQRKIEKNSPEGSDPDVDNLNPDDVDNLNPDVDNLNPTDSAEDEKGTSAPPAGVTV